MAIPTHSAARSPLLPVGVWLFFQLGALGLSAARIPFYAVKSFPQPAELIALPLMLVVQIGLSALLFPFLLRDVRAAGLVMVSSWPFTILAAVLTGLPNKRMMTELIAFNSAWLLGLALWRGALRSTRSQAVGVVLAALTALAGPLYYYLQMEYGSSSRPQSMERGGPLLQAVSIANLNPVSTRVWVFTGGYLLIAATACLVRRGFNRAA